MGEMASVGAVLLVYIAEVRFLVATLGKPRRDGSWIIVKEIPMRHLDKSSLCLLTCRYTTNLAVVEHRHDSSGGWAAGDGHGGERVAYNMSRGAHHAC